MRWELSPLERSKVTKEVPVLRSLGWWAGCVTGYPTKPWHRWRVVEWLRRFDPVEYP